MTLRVRSHDQLDVSPRMLRPKRKCSSSSLPRDQWCKPCKGKKKARCRGTAAATTTALPIRQSNRVAGTFPVSLEVAMCEPDHSGEWMGKWESCRIVPCACGIEAKGWVTVICQHDGRTCVVPATKFYAVCGAVWCFLCTYLPKEWWGVTSICVAHC